MGEGKPEEIEKLLDRVRDFKESNKFEKVIVFGSYGRGNFGKESNVDLIISDERFEGKDSIERSREMWIDWHLKHKIGKR